MAITLNGTTGITTPALTSDGVVFADNTPSNTLVTDTSGNVGIGTSSPYGKLDVYSGTDRHLGFAAAATLSTGSSINSLNDAGTANQGLEIRASDCVWYNTGTELMRLASTGIVTGYAGNLMLVSGTAVSAATTVVDFTNIPSWVKRITVMFKGVSTNSSSNILVRLGTGATPTYVTTGYVSGSSTSSATNTTATNGFFAVNSVAAGEVYTGTITLMNFSGTDWVATNHVCNTGTGNTRIGGGYLALGATLTAVRITSATPDTFDLGSINIMYE